MLQTVLNSLNAKTLDKMAFLSKSNEVSGGGGGGGLRDIEIKPPFVKIQDHYYRESCTLLIM